MIVSWSSVSCSTRSTWTFLRHEIFEKEFVGIGQASILKSLVFMITSKQKLSCKNKLFSKKFETERKSNGEIVGKMKQVKIKLIRECRMWLSWLEGIRVYIEFPPLIYKNNRKIFTIFNLLIGRCHAISIDTCKKPTLSLFLTRS